jgi:hypothetical protein
MMWARQTTTTRDRFRLGRFVVAALGTALLLPAAQVSAKLEQRYGWVDRGTSDAAGAFVVHRKGKPVPYTEAGLMRCDKVEWTDVTRPVLVRLSDGRKFLFSQTGPNREFTVPCDQRGIAAAAMAAILGFVSASDRKTVEVAAAMASRNVGVSQRPMRLAAPLLDVETPELVAGPRALYVRWIGGESPFEVTLTDKSTGEVLARRAGLSSREVTLPTVTLKPGSYQLRIQQPKGPTGHILSEDALTVVEANSLPAMPDVSELKELPAGVRELVYADYLAGLEQGRWKFEAAQRVATLAKRNAAARDWLSYAAGDFAPTSKP